MLDNRQVANTMCAYTCAQQQQPPTTRPPTSKSQKCRCVAITRLFVHFSHRSYSQNAFFSEESERVSERNEALLNKRRMHFVCVEGKVPFSAAFFPHTRVIAANSISGCMRARAFILLLQKKKERGVCGEGGIHMSIIRRRLASHPDSIVLCFEREASRHHRLPPTCTAVAAAAAAAHKDKAK